jgi:hypothetical protein
LSGGGGGVITTFLLSLTADRQDIVSGSTWRRSCRRS